MARYVDGFVLTVKKDRLDDYKKIASEAGDIWMKHGALEYVECAGDDLNPDMGEEKILTFPELAKPGPDEIVLFSFIIYKSRKHRDEVNEKVMNDPLMKDPTSKDKPMPFDMKKMAYGGFITIVDL